jgi:hypothetical protein
MSEFEKQVESLIQEIKVFLNKKPVKYLKRIAFAIINVVIICFLWSTIEYRLELYTGFMLENLVKYFSEPHTAEVAGREFELPSGYFLYDEPKDTNDFFLWAAIDLSTSSIIYKEYYNEENSSYSDTCYKQFKTVATEFYQSKVNKVVAKYRYGDYDVYMCRHYVFVGWKAYMIDYAACIPEKRINFTYCKWSIFSKDYEYFKQLVEDICLKDTEGEFLFQGSINYDE